MPFLAFVVIFIERWAVGTIRSVVGVAIFSCRRSIFAMVRFDIVFDVAFLVLRLLMGIGNELGGCVGGIPLVENEKGFGGSFRFNTKIPSHAFWLILIAYPRFSRTYYADRQDCSTPVISKNMNLSISKIHQKPNIISLKNDLRYFFGFLGAVWWVHSPEYWFLGAMVLTSTSRNHKKIEFHGFWNMELNSYW